MFFDSNRKRLERVRADSFAAWLADWLCVNRATGVFRFILSAVETAALSGPDTTGILPENFWTARPDKLYLSNGDGGLVRITASGVEIVDNGSDGVLFAAGTTLAPWRLTEPRDPFESCALFRNVHCGASHGKLLLQLWIYSFATMPRSKPPVGLIGEIGSGKTRTAKGISELYGIPPRMSKVEESLETNFWPNVNEGGLFVLDNADSRSKWLADAVAAAATDGCSQRRRLYTNSETVLLRANSWLAITSQNPTFGNDAGLADRLILLRMARRDVETSDAALTDEILINRDSAVSHIAATLSKALADAGPTPPGLNPRHPDFAAFAVKIGRGLNREADAIGALRNAEADNPPSVWKTMLWHRRCWPICARRGNSAGPRRSSRQNSLRQTKTLTAHLSAKRLGKRLVALWPHLQKTLTARKDKTATTCLVHIQRARGMRGFNRTFSKTPYTRMHIETLSKTAKQTLHTTQSAGSSQGTGTARPRAGIGKWLTERYLSNLLLTALPLVPGRSPVLL